MQPIEHLVSCISFNTHFPKIQPDIFYNLQISSFPIDCKYTFILQVNIVASAALSLLNRDTLF